MLNPHDGPGRAPTEPKSGGLLIKREISFSEKGFLELCDLPRLELNFFPFHCSPKLTAAVSQCSGCTQDGVEGPLFQEIYLDVTVRHCSAHSASRS
jgi:hypothetical protein